MAGNKIGENNTCVKQGAHLFTDGNGYADEILRTGETMTEIAKLRRRLFAAHYIKTTSATQAAVFAGFKSPSVKGKKLLQEPYVQYLISEMLNGIEKDAVMTQTEIMFAMKREALDTDSGNQGARISALAHLAKIQGMMVDRSETKHTMDGGVMVVPAVTDPDAWSETAAASQAKLKDDVRK